MEVLIIISVILLTLVGIAGCIIPGLPGPPLNLAGLLLVHFFLLPVDKTTLALLVMLTAVVLFLDYVMPVWFSKRYGASRGGIIGSIAGMFLGLFFTPVGMILGTLLGAIIGDLLAGRDLSKAIKSGFATFIGTMMAVGLKLINAGLLTFFTLKDIIQFYSTAGN